MYPANSHDIKNVLILSKDFISQYQGARIIRSPLSLIKNLLFITWV